MRNKFIIVVTQYNAAEYIRRCLDSINSQDYDNFEVVVVDDCSNDGTWDIVEQYPFHHIRNYERNAWGFVNILQGIRYLPSDKEDIIVLVSGDDYLANDHVLSRLNEAYQQDIWLTYGQFIPLSGNYGPYCKPIPDTRTYRKTGDWVTSHLLTFKLWLFDRIKTEDLMCDGEYTRYACDTAFMYPMIEMAGEKHIKFIEDILYIYNDLNPTCLYKLVPEDSKREAAYFKSKNSYPQL